MLDRVGRWILRREVRKLEALQRAAELRRAALLAALLLVSCAPMPASSPEPPLASRLWPQAYELCPAGESWPACFDRLETRWGAWPDAIRLRAGADLICARASTWEDCFERLEQAGDAS